MKQAAKLRQTVDRLHRKIAAMAREKSRTSVFDDNDEQVMMEISQMKQEIEQVSPQIDKLVERAAQARVQIDITRSLKQILTHELQAVELDYKLLHAKRCQLMRTREEKKTKIDHGFGDKGTRLSSSQQSRHSRPCAVQERYTSTHQRREASHPETPTPAAETKRRTCSCKKSAKKPRVSGWTKRKR